MPNGIRIKRRAAGGAAGAPASLLNAELAFNEQDNVLYYGKGLSGSNAAQVIAIGGPGAFATTTALNDYLPLTGGTITSSLTVGSNLTVSGNLTVNGTTTTINSTVVSVDDINIILGDIASPTNTTADGGGITLKGATDKTLNWVSATSAWTSSEDFNLLSSKVYRIAGTTVLSATALGTGVTGSSLTSVGTLTSGSLGSGFTTVAVAQGGTGATALTGLIKGNGTSAFSAAVAGTDFLSPDSDINGGTF